MVYIWLISLQDLQWGLEHPVPGDAALVRLMAYLKATLELVGTYSPDAVTICNLSSPRMPIGTAMLAQPAA